MRPALLLLVALPLVVRSATLDQEMARGMAESLEGESLVISLREDRLRRRHRVENILSVQAPHSQFTFGLDPSTSTVSLELGLEKRELKMGRISEERGLGSLVLLVQAKSVTLWHNCELQAKTTLPRSLPEVFPKNIRNHLKVYRERRYSMELDKDTDVEEVLARHGCHRPDRMQSQQPDNDLSLSPRGDIPIIHDCDDNLLVKTINELIKVVKRLQEELEGQRVETRNLRQLLEQCDVCRQESDVKDTCRNKPCFPGVECRESDDGPRCGRCPPGYVGDGRSCKPGITCDQHPCYPGVRCYDTVEGFQCGPCPGGFTGNGQHCKPRAGCENNPCSPGVQCQNTHDPPFYRCGSCPAGFTGNGTNCHDLDECDLAEPCDPRVHCTNLSPGFRCGPCPAGYTGSGGLEGVGLDTAARVRQHCYDLDECADGRNGGCTPNSLCHNTEGSFTCGNCKNGYVGNQTIGCHSSPGLCPDGTRCDTNAECVKAGGSRYGCKCKVGWAGDGRVCGPDRDLDGWPDYDLSCSDSRCRKEH